jgi:HJR/Mrr/RecB family endonuclease
MGISEEKAEQGRVAAETLRVLRDRKSDSKYRKWKKAREALLAHPLEECAKSSSRAESRIRYLQVREPVPALQDFVPILVPRGTDARISALHKAQSDLDAALVQRAQREEERLQELEHAKRLLKEVRKRENAEHRKHQRAVEAARREYQRAADAAQLKRQLAMWPAHVLLDPEIASTPGIDWQVFRECQRIEIQVRALSELLERGLKDLGPVVFDDHCDVDSINSERIASDAEVALIGMRTGIDHKPQVKVAYLRDSRQLVIEYVLPDVSVIPKAKSYRYVKSKDEVVESARPASQIKTLYANAIAQLTLLCLATVFADDTKGAVDVIAFNGVVETLDPRTGLPVRPCLITVRVTRESFAALNLNHVDPQACLKHLSAGISRSPTELAPVKPVLEFSMVDPRFVDAVDAISTMDDRPNLLELKWTEFESLIQNLFTKMGLEARQTRPSRDGGVDCIAYDTRPIFGGKIVIQAKRYKNTVGVSAVRDLFGTLQNEGASKGILVTTSGYGAASFEFAQNKPIELIEGANLLYLLETYAGIRARIEPPDDWRDPEPDNGEFH